MIENNELSERSLVLSTEAIHACPGYYSAWRLRRELITSLNKSLEDELNFLNKVSLTTPKNYQIWSYRREIIELRQSASGELEFLSLIFDLDSKNIHAWGYRQWLVKKFGLWGEDRAYALHLIEKDNFNNSAWNQLMFVSRFDGTLDDFDRKNEEIRFVLGFCREKSNECPFNYLRGLWTPENSVMIKEAVFGILKDLQGFVNLYKVLAYFYEREGNKDMMRTCFEMLEKEDVVREKFWAWKKNNCSGESLGRHGIDEEIYRLLLKTELV